MVYFSAIQALTTVVLGAIAVYIAWRQWRTAQDRLAVDLFERRFQAFQELTQTITGAFNTKASVTIDDLAKFDVATEKARYLFGAEVHNYLKEVRPKLIAIYTGEFALRSMPDGEARTRAEKGLTDWLGEMHQFYEKLAVMLTPYLRISAKSR